MPAVSVCHLLGSESPTSTALRLLQHLFLQRTNGLLGREVGVACSDRDEEITR